MSEVYVIEHGSEPRPATVIAVGEKKTYVEFDDARGGRRWCLPSSVYHTRAEAVRVEREMEGAR